MAHLVKTLAFFLCNVMFFSTIPKTQIILLIYLLGINTRDGAQLLIENNVWVGCNDTIYATDVGYAVARGNDYGGISPTAGVGNLTTAPYSYSLTAIGSVKSSVLATAGNNLSF
jgi:pectate lyase